MISTTNESSAAAMMHHIADEAEHIDNNFKFLSEEELIFRESYNCY